MNDKLKQRILLIDDDKHLLKTLSDFLRFENFDVEQAHDGEEAFHALDTFDPDLIVLDISMPGMGGLNFLRHVSAKDANPSYPVLVLTAR